MITTDAVPAPLRLVRVGRAPDPLAFPDPAFVGSGRFDDPGRHTRTLYTADLLFTCYLELLAQFRPSPSLIARLRAMDGVDTAPLAGRIPRDWHQLRRIGWLEIERGQRLLDLRLLGTRERLRTELADLLVSLGMPDLDVSAVRGSSRRLTQAIARWAVLHDYVGVLHTSRIDDGFTCAALFEQARFRTIGSPEPVRLDDPELVRAANVLSLELP